MESTLVFTLRVAQTDVTLSHNYMIVFII